jgi:hypothetical protein
VTSGWMGSQFKAAASGKTREQLHEKFGPPDELGAWGAQVGWDGPVSIYLDGGRER